MVFNDETADDWKQNCNLKHLYFPAESTPFHCHLKASCESLSLRGGRRVDSMICEGTVLLQMMLILTGMISINISHFSII
jgi:hypothetical protein